MNFDEKEVERKNTERLRRDEFAKAALTGLVTHLALDDIRDIAEGILAGSMVTTAAWKLADRMIEREKKT